MFRVIRGSYFQNLNKTIHELTRNTRRHSRGRYYSNTVVFPDNQCECTNIKRVVWSLRDTCGDGVANDLVWKISEHAHATVSLWCEVCGETVAMVTPGRAAEILITNPRAIYRLVERGDVHFVEAGGGEVLPDLQTKDEIF